MRGRKDMNRSQGRRRRRCLLAGLLCASGQGAWAEVPVAIAPLPLAVPFEQGGQYVQINPFCRPLPATPDDATVHAAGVIQLTPLEEFPESQVMQSSGQQFETPLTTTADGGVQFRIEASSPQVSDDAVTFSFSDDSAAAAEPTLVRPAPTAHPTVATLPEPVQLVPNEFQPQPRPGAVWRGGSEQVAHVDPPSLAGPDNESRLSGPTLARPAAASQKTLLVPIEERQGAHVVTAVGSSRLPAPPRSNEEPRLVNGARPKVEVGRPPLVIQRGQSRILTVEPERPAPVPAQRVVETEQKLQPLPEPLPEPVAEPLPELVAKANLRFQPTEVRALKVDNPIQRVEIQSVAVCAAVKTGSHQVQLIATGVGKTKLTLWTMDADGREQGELYEIQVADAKAAQADDAQSLAATLSQSIQTAFPQSDILVRYHGGRLQITGNCPDEDSARRILRMVRSACPMPVDDKITVRY